MRSNLFLAALLALFVAVLGWLVWLRFDAGDQFPPYSTLRADPLGARAFAEALEQSGLTVERDYRPLPSVGAPLVPATRFWLGFAPWAAAGDRPFAALRSFAVQGNRVVIAFSAYSELKPACADSSCPADSAPCRRDTAEVCGGDGDRQFSPRPVLEQFLGCTLGADTRPLPATPARRVAGGDGPLAETLPWHRSYYFESLSPEWRVRYVHDGRPVLIERRCGSGTVILVADVFFLSNESLQANRCAGTLAWLVGPHRAVSFHEHHLGVAESRGLVAMARDHGLGYGLLALLAFAALSLWRAAVSFVPPPAEDEAPPDPAGRAADGLASLLTRHLSPAQLPAACLAAWEARERSPAPALAAARARLAAAERKRLGARDILAVYRDLRRILDPKGRATGGFRHRDTETLR